MLHLSSEERVSTDFNGYAGFWSDAGDEGFAAEHPYGDQGALRIECDGKQVDRDGIGDGIRGETNEPQLRSGQDDIEKKKRWKLTMVSSSVPPIDFVGLARAVLG
ncbi:MAG TPA: hypothetical protein VFW25_01760 [Silvibacterium sp.]|nr:hypothetical protein [Silvibacterium sp.]